MNPGATLSPRSVVTSSASQQGDMVDRSPHPNSQPSPSGPNFFQSSRNVEVNRSNFHTIQGPQTTIIVNPVAGHPSDESSAPCTQSSIPDGQPSSHAGQHLLNCETSVASLSQATQRSSEIYARQLTPKGRGFALWIPEPQRSLTIEHRRVGVRIGDVGVITPRGSFSFLFNILDPSAFQSPAISCPFSPISETIEICEESEFGPRSYLATSSIKQSECDLASGMTFKMSASEGVLIAMPEGAISKDVENVACVRKYVACNLTAWYRYVNGPRGRDARNGDIRIVVGCDKSTSCGMAVMTNTAHGMNHQLKLRSHQNPNSDAPISTYIWEHSGLAEVRAGPSVQEIEELRAEDQSPPEDGKYRNRCLFLRTMNPTLGAKEWLELCRDLNTPHLVDTSHHKTTNHGQDRNGSRRNGQSSSSAGTSGGGRAPPRWSFREGHSFSEGSPENCPSSFVPGGVSMSNPPVAMSFHPSEFINRMLFTKAPNAKMVISDDSNWFPILNESEHTIPCDEELFERVLESHQIEEDNGIVFLQSKKLRQDSTDLELQNALYVPLDGLRCSEPPSSSGRKESALLSCHQDSNFEQYDMSYHYSTGRVNASLTQPQEATVDDMGGDYIHTTHPPNDDVHELEMLSPYIYPQLMQMQPNAAGSSYSSDNEHTQDSSSRTDRPRFTHREQLGLFRDALNLPMDGAGPFIPQMMYKPHTTGDRKRYVEDITLEAPLYFYSDHPTQCGILLKDALQSRTKNLRNRNQVVFEGRGPSVSIHLEWPGYREWRRQIPTKNLRSPSGPITLSQLAKNIAKCVQRFMQDRKSLPMEEVADQQWRIGDGPDDIKLEDLVLVSIHHVSLGSWQPHLRLVRPHTNFLSPSSRHAVGDKTSTSTAAAMVLPSTPIPRTNTFLLGLPCGPPSRLETWTGKPRSEQQNDGGINDGLPGTDEHNMDLDHLEEKAGATLSGRSELLGD